MIPHLAIPDDRNQNPYLSFPYLWTDEYGKNREVPKLMWRDRGEVETGEELI